STYTADRHLHSFPTRRSSDLPLTIVMASNANPRLKINRPFRKTKFNILAGIGFHQAVLDTLSKSRRICRRLNSQINIVSITIHEDRKSTRLNSSHVKISYAVF